MQVFKAFFISLRRQYKSTLIYIGVFAIIEGLLFSFMTDQSYGNFTKTKVTVAVFDHDNSEESKALYDYLANTQQIVTIKEDKDSIADELFNRNVNYVLTIQDGFADDFTLLENVKQSGSSAGYFLDQNIDQYLKLLESYQTAGYTTAEAIELANSSVEKEAVVTVASGERLEQDESRTVSFFKYLPYFFVAIMVTSLGSILCIFRQKEISARTQCSSLSIMKRNLQMGLSCFVFGLFLFLLFIIYGAVLNGSSFFQTSTLLCILNAFVCMLFTLSLTMLISFFVHSDNTLNLVANVAGLGACFIGGVFVPLDVLSSTVKSIAKFLPTYWYVMANDIANTYNGSATQLRTYFGYLGIQCLFIIAVIALALVSSKAKKTA